MEEQKIKTIKGFDHNLQCRGKQYEVGQTYTEEGKPEVCEHGMHAISPEASPLSVFSYYPPSDNGKPSRYCEVEASGDIASDGEKIAASKLTVGAEIGIPGLVKAHVEWVRQHITNEHNAEPGKPATAGDGGAATAGYGGAATAGYRGAATSRGSSAVEENGVAVARGNYIKVKGGIGSLLVIAKEYSNTYDIKEWKAAIVDGETIKADTWYTVENGKWIEVTE